MLIYLKMAAYVKNADLKREIIKSKQSGELTSEALNMLILMSNRMSHKLSYKYEEDRQDCIAGSIMDCFLYWRGYDAEKSDNAFAYFTSIIRNGAAKSFKRIYGHFPMSSKVSISQNNLYNI